ncbi:MAG: deoxyguanosine kinase [Gammaproteobacteria bacterium]|jgi:deoxyguanosine kinase
MAGYRYIAIEGPIGVGKTTLARRLADYLGAELMLEAPFENPFLARFYENQRAWALSAQLSFLLQRAQQVRELNQRDLFSSVRVADFMLAKDRLFATLNLDADELALYEQIYARVIDDAPTPDVVIYLQAPVPLLAERIQRRGIEFEQGIAPDYLHRIIQAYTRYFSPADDTPFPRVLVANTADADFVSRDDHFALLVEQLDSLTQGLTIFDPDVLGVVDLPTSLQPRSQL